MLLNAPGPWNFKEELVFAFFFPNDSDNNPVMAWMFVLSQPQLHMLKS